MSDFLKLFLGLLLVIVVIYFVLQVFEKTVTEETISIKVDKIEKVVTDDDEVLYLIYTKNEIFENRNNYQYPKENESKQGIKLKIGSSYRVKVVGFNFGVKLPLFLGHRNIVEIVDTKSIIILN
ncbi:MAG: hypothetical protein KKE09_00345 [Bacteroidetes bacterium]|nr:hypothetical protein [Bacteroidota bacterium]